MTLDEKQVLQDRLEASLASTAAADAADETSVELLDATLDDQLQQGAAITASNAADFMSSRGCCTLIVSDAALSLYTPA